MFVNNLRVKIISNVEYGKINNKEKKLQMTSCKLLDSLKKLLKKKRKKL
jgi:hypothetical protein